ncbi:MAG: hypothetical protein ACFFDN_45630 [Candidatus Hodarchaeota archaeon]
MVSKVIQDTIPEREKDDRIKSWLIKARNVNDIIDDLRGVSNTKPENRNERIDLDLSIWQKLSFGWIIAWIGITCFFIIQIFIDPIFWENNWVLLPYFFYYISFGVIFFFKKVK